MKVWIHLPDGKLVQADVAPEHTFSEIIHGLRECGELLGDGPYDVCLIPGQHVKLGSPLLVTHGARLIVTARARPSELGKDSAPEAIPAEQPARSSISLYHLSDLHFVQKPQVNRKHSFGDVLDSQLGSRPYEVFERFLPTQIEGEDQTSRYLIVTGDLANRAAYEELEEGVAFIARTARSFEPTIPDERVVVVPGNHDVDWNTAVGSRWISRKFDSFKGRLTDAGYGFLLPAFKATHGNPCRFFAVDGIVIYALNSCLLGGVVRQRARKAQLTKADLEGVRRILKEHYAKDMELVTSVEQLLDKLGVIDESSSVIDAGLVGTDFIGRIPKDLDKIKKGLTTPQEKEAFQRSLRIAVLHHHVSPFAPTEVKEFEALVDAGELKSILLQCGFHLVLHGHKHQPRITRESIVNKRGEQSLVIISAGSIGDWQTGSSFNVIRLSDPLADEVQVQISFMTMSRDGTTYETEALPSFSINK